MIALALYTYTAIYSLAYMISGHSFIDQNHYPTLRSIIGFYCATLYMYIYATISENRHTCNFHIARSVAPNTHPRACIRAANSRIYSQSRVFRLIYFIIAGISVAIYQNTNLNHSNTVPLPQFIKIYKYLENFWRQFGTKSYGMGGGRGGGFFNFEGTF